MITVLDAGDFTTIQDAGRWGYQAFGLPVTGAMDRYAYQAANALAGNRATAAVIEMTTRGGSFKFDSEQLVAVCGAAMHGEIDGKPITNWSSFVVPKRGELRFAAAVTGCRTYLAVHGGIDVPAVLGSKSTDTRSRIGGYQGRKLRLGDVLYIGQENTGNAIPRLLTSEAVPQYSPDISLRVILGPQDTLFSEAAIQLFFSNRYTVINKANREGYLLEGPKIVTNTKEPDIVSDAVGLGAIQIPANGQPFIVTADHQTARGFPKLGYVIRVDLSKLVQARQGEFIRFQPVPEQIAIQALQQEQQVIAQLFTQP